MSSTSEQQRPEGRLIAQAITARGLSVRKAAKGTGITDTRLRHIINGYAPVGRGQRVEVVAPADTLARIAHSLDITPEQLREAGRDDAAAVLAELERLHPAPSAGIVYDISRYDEALQILADWLDAMAHDDEAPAHPPTAALWLWSPSQLAEALAEQTSVVEAQLQTELRRHFAELRARGGERSGDDPAATIDVATVSGLSVDLEPEPTATRRHDVG